MLDLVEEALDQVPSAVEVRAEADRLVSIAPRWDVGPGALLDGKCSDPICIITSVGQQQRFRLQARQEFAGKPVVMRLTGCQREPDRQAISIDHRMNLAGQSTS